MHERHVQDAGAPLRRWAHGFILLLALVALTLGGCEEQRPAAGGWRLVATQRPEAFLSVAGRSARDVYVVGADKGRGPVVLHYNGEAWEELATGHRGDLWWVHAFAEGPVLMAGAHGSILRYEEGQFTRMRTPGLARHTVYGVWGSHPSNVYAVGSVGSRSGFIWHYNGAEWRELEVPHEALPRTADGDIPGFFKVWGTAGGDVYVVGARGVVLRSRQGGPFEVLATGSDYRLFTVHGAGDTVAVAGGESNGTLLELDSAGSFQEKAPDACPLLQGVVLAEDGSGYATGLFGEVFRRSGGRWEPVEHKLPVQAESLHAVWRDPEGGVWAVGGNVLASGLDGGAILHLGAQVPELPAVPSLQPPQPTCPAEAVDPRPAASIARRWNEQILGAIRRDIPRPTVHARNLYHVSAAMWDAWAAYDATADGVFVHEKHSAADVAQARHEALSYAAYRVLAHRYTPAIGGPTSAACFRAFMQKLGYDPEATGTEGSSPRALGNRIAQALIRLGESDGANEQNDYRDNTGYTFSNPPLLVDEPGTQVNDPAVWQPLNLAVAITQNGLIAPSGIQDYIGPHWGGVTPFALRRPAGGGLYFDPGPPPAMGEELRLHVVDVLRKTALLGSQERMDASPGGYGNNSLGADDGRGHPLNPATGQPYLAQWVRRGDFGRVLAEYWADGPRSETPPGHWNVIANSVADRPEFRRRLFGTGSELEPLEWDVKTYLALNGATHDAAIVAWEVKRAANSARPISLIRYMGGKGQSSNPSGPAYHPQGLPLVPGLIEVITPESSAPGGRHAHLARFQGQVALYSWRGEPGDRKGEVGGIGWIRAVEWMPYQLRTFVTPAFPGFISGHSTFSRASAEVLTALTGSPYFPGGLGEFVARRNGYLTFEQGPSEEVRLQWATYYDAADQAGQSRLWGGIHILPDDYVGRRLGHRAGLGAVERARAFFEGTARP